MIKGTKKTDFKNKEIRVIHNTEKAPFVGSVYGQDKEPSGYYCVQQSDNFKPEKWEVRTIKLSNPLIIDTSADMVFWKFALSDKYGLSGKKLTNQLIKEGYDGIITVDKKGKYAGYTGEIIVFNVKKSTL